MSTTVTKEISGRKIEVEISDSLTFNADVDGKRFYADTWSALEEKLKRAVRVAKVEHHIPVVIPYGTNGYLTRLTVRGINHRTNEILVTVHGQKDSIKDHYSSHVFKHDEVTDAEIAEENRLAKEVEEAKAKYHAHINGLLSRARTRRRMAKEPEHLHLEKMVERAEEALQGVSS